MLGRLYVVLLAMMLGHIMNLTGQADRCIWADDNGLRMCVYRGTQAEQFFDDIARLRITLFSPYPYLYQGNTHYEREYLASYFSCERATIILLFDHDRVVGFSSSLPLEEESHDIREPFVHQKASLGQYLYIGEVMLEAKYRGKGLLRMFFDYHERGARSAGFRYTLFMTVDRPDSHPQRPPYYRDLTPIWQHFGYEKSPQYTIRCAWPQVDTGATEINTLSVWIKSVS